MIVKQHYFSNEYWFAALLCGLAHDEIEQIVGRFAPHSSRAGQLRGRAVLLADGSVEIRTSFGEKILWTSRD